MIKLFIENKELDINQGFSNQITYAIDDLQNLDTKANSFSKTIVLPGSTNNNKLLGNIFDFANSNFYNNNAPNVEYNFNASKSAKMKLEMNGLQIMKGVLRLLNININNSVIEYEIALFGEMTGFISKIAGSKIEQLDFSDYDHVWDSTNIVNSWDNANAGEGYYYPLIDVGNVSQYSNNAQAQGHFNKIDYEVRAYRPALFVKEYIDKIITSAGYTWESNFFNTNFFKSLIIPYNEKVFVKRNATKYLTAQRDINLICSATQNEPERTTYVPWPTYNLYSNFTINNLNNKFTFTGSFDTTVVIKGRIQGYTTGNVNNTYKVGIERVGGILDWGIETFIEANQSFVWDFNQTVIIRPGEGISMFGYVFLELGVSAKITITHASLDVSPLLNSYVEYQIGNQIEINTIIPKNIYQKDFFASILKMFYLMVTEDKFKERHLVIEPWVDFYENDRTTYLDWSDKIDRNNNIKIVPMSESNHRTYELKYKDDNDYFNEMYKKRYNKSYGQINYDTNLEFAKETSKTEVIFSPTVLVGYDNCEKIVSTIFKKSNNVEEAIDHNIRILQAKKIALTQTYNVTVTTAINGTQNYITNLSQYGYAGHLDNPKNCNIDSNFGALNETFFTLSAGNLSNNLFNAFYSSYLAEITDKDSRLLTVTMKFTEQEIFNLNFAKYIFIDGVLYRLQKIIDYTPGELCKVELLRVISTNYQ